MSARRGARRPTIDIQAQVGYELTSFCYPVGLYGAREVGLVRAAGYRAAVTKDPAVNAGGAEPETLRRRPSA